MGMGLAALMTAAMVAFLALAAPVAPAAPPPAAPAAPSDNPFVQDGKLAKAFCSSPEFSKLGCQYNGIMGDAEQKAVVRAQCGMCGTAMAALPKDLPATLSGVAGSGGRDPDKLWHLRLASLACRGRIVVRSVFKLVKQWGDGAPLPNGWKNCTFAYPQDSMGSGWQRSSWVRCELELPPGPEPEAQRATRAKEGRCYVCNVCAAIDPFCAEAGIDGGGISVNGTWEPDKVEFSAGCHNGGGCPSVNGRWYSDSYTATLPGCDFNAEEGFRAYQVGIVTYPKTELQLAKFEVCQGTTCFNRPSEEAKVRSARRCAKGIC